jgi:CRISPR/Cas system-associated exonuclease Cas4 (RecB family)
MQSKSDLLKNAGQVFRDKEKLVSLVSRYLVKQTETERREDCIHPSEVSHSDWCPRATYYRIINTEKEPEPKNLIFEVVFETGHDAHRKWQSWFRDMDILRGNWKCLSCQLIWEDVSPTECPRCELGKDLIQYVEVPVFSNEHLLAGFADGDVYVDGDFRLIEIKSVGTGTARFEAPNMVEQYTNEAGTDWKSLWNGIRKPFNSHLKQGMIYCFCKGRDSITFIYDPKFVTAFPKEFTVKFNMSIIEDILKECLVIKSCLEKERTPKRPMWAEIKNPVCKKCVYRKVCYAH